MNREKRIKWQIRSTADELKNSQKANEIAQALSLSLPTAGLLIDRGCDTPEAAERFLGKREEQLYDPFLMKDMDLAVERICRALDRGERIIIYGDYDVDGVTSVSALKLYLDSKGGDAGYYIPKRDTDGYGVSMGAIERLASEGCDLIITVDTGITAVDEIKKAGELGMDVVVTDHHECQDTLPGAVAVVNPKRSDCGYPFSELAGVGVVFKLLCALESSLCPDDSMAECVRRIAREYCDLVAIGTIADVMPVVDENRLIISYGLSLIERGTRPAIEELIEVSTSENKRNGKKKITAGFIGFTIAPRINAAGRIRDASIAAELFLTDDRDEARRLAETLCAINKERQEIENEIIEVAYAKIASEHDFEHDPVIVLDDETWHHGIIGIVASRITEKYGLSSILISFEGGGDRGKGSGRSVKGVNLVEALASCSDLLEKYGGHELAAGLTVKRENLDAFKKRINDFVREKLKDAEGGGEPVIEADLELTPDDVTMELAEELYLLEPFGTSNPTPVFAMYGLFIADESTVGGGKHTRLQLKRENMAVTAMCFRKSIADIDLYPGDVVDVLFGLDVNEFQGVRTLQMIVRDVRLTSVRYDAEERERAIYDAVTAGEGISPELTDEERRNALPEREDFAAVYNVLKKELRVDHRVFSIRALRHLLMTRGYNIPYVKLKAIIMIFRELNVVGVEETDRDGEVFEFRYVFVKNKTSLDKSGILKKIRNELRLG